MLGCRTILHLLSIRSGESITFSVPDPNALWSRAEDGILVQAVVTRRLYFVYYNGESESEREEMRVSVLMKDKELNLEDAKVPSTLG